MFVGWRSILTHFFHCDMLNSQSKRLLSYRNVYYAIKGNEMITFGRQKEINLRFNWGLQIHCAFVTDAFVKLIEKNVLHKYNIFDNYLIINIYYIDIFNNFHIIRNIFLDNL